jgi:hypothetical protein
VLRDVPVMLADRGNCVTDIEAYRGQPHPSLATISRQPDMHG